jgi:hypothetical protein
MAIGNRATLAALAVPAVVLSLAACGSPKPVAHGDPAACQVAMYKDLAAAEANSSGPDMGRPRACDGLSNSTVDRLANQVMDEYFKKAMGS